MTCDAHASCSSDNGTAVCKCDVGYEGDGQNCTSKSDMVDTPIPAPINFIIQSLILADIIHAASMVIVIVLVWLGIARASMDLHGPPEGSDVKVKLQVIPRRTYC